MGGKIINVSENELISVVNKLGELSQEIEDMDDSLGIKGKSHQFTEFIERVDSISIALE